MATLLHRRALLSSLLAAPLIVRTPGLLMPIRPARRPRLPAGWVREPAYAQMTYMVYQDDGSDVWKVMRTG